MRFEDKDDRQLGEGDRRKQFFASFYFLNCTISNINKLNCCWSDCENSAIHFDSWNHRDVKGIQAFPSDDISAPFPSLTDCLERIEQRYEVRGELGLFVLLFEREIASSFIAGSVKW